MTTASKRSISLVDTAKMLRGALKAEFPGTKFSVRSKSYSGGASITASWTDGPTSAAVQKVCDRYNGAEFDGMIDLKSYKDSIITTADGMETVSFGADYVFTRREFSDEFMATCEEQIVADLGRKIDPEERLNDGGGYRMKDGTLLSQVMYGSELVRGLAYQTDARGKAVTTNECSG